MKTIQSIDKAMMILDYISRNNGSSTLTGISGALDMKITTLHGLISTLEAWDLVSKNRDTGRYALGSRLFQLGKVFEGNLSVKEICHPYLVRLADEFGETVHLAIPSEQKILYIDKVESKHPVRLTSMVGTTDTFLNSAIGMIVLAQLSPGVWYDVADAQGIERSNLSDQLQKIKADGYYIKEEQESGFYCIAVGISNIYNTVAGISIVVPFCRCSQKLFPGIIASMQEAAKVIQDNWLSPP